MHPFIDNLTANSFAQCFVGLLVLFYILSLLLPLTEPSDLFGLVTVNTLIAKTYVWNILTCCVFETNIFKLVTELLIFLWIPNRFHRSPNEQFVLCIVFSILASSLTTSFYCLIRFFSTGLEETVMDPIFGFSGVLVTYLMYARQSLKDQPFLVSFPYITYHNISIIILLAQVFFWCIGLKFLMRDIPFTFVSILFSWSYLRFYYKNHDGVVGNPDPEFSFVVMFPELLYPIMIPLSTAFYNIIVLFGWFPAMETSQKLPTHHLRQNELVASADVVSERRKAKALKLLDAKMAELYKAPADGLHTIIESPTEVHV